MAKITINGEVVKVKSNATILDAVRSIGLDIPTLCFIKEINEIGFCRMCVVEVEGEQDLVSACNTNITNGMVIKTDSDKIIESRTTTLQLLASKHRFDCWRCPKDGMCEFYDLLKEHDVVFEEFGPGIGRNPEQIFGTGISQDQSKCVLCKRCVAVCQNVVTANVLKFRDDDGINPIVSPTPGLTFDESGCIFCGQCVKACPTGTLFETNHVKEVEGLIRNKDLTVAVQIAPEVESAIAEEFGYDLGTPAEELKPKIYEALKLLGFDEITDTAWARDLTITEQANELVNRMKDGGSLPLFTSSCAAWVRYAELYQPEYLEHLSTTKSPHTMQGALIKNFFAKKYLDKNPDQVAVVTIAPCTAKKYEITRSEMEVDGIRDVDAVLTVREISKMLKRKGIDVKRLKGNPVENKLGDLFKSNEITNSSALEATLNVVSNIIDSKPLDELNYKLVHGSSPEDSKGIIQEATVTIGGNKLNVAVIHGGAAIKAFFKQMQTNKKKYHFVEVLSCPGGCLNGGGMPLANDIPVHEVLRRRNEALCNQPTENSTIRNSQENDIVKRTYIEFLGDVNSKTATKYLHTHYSQKEFRKE